MQGFQLWVPEAEKKRRAEDEEDELMAEKKGGGYGEGEEAEVVEGRVPIW